MGLLYHVLTPCFFLSAASVDYRKNNGHTCVLFFVMSYGQPGLIYCHGNQEGNYKSIVELKDLQEAFQPQNNSTLALKPKFFIVQVIGSVNVYTFVDYYIKEVDLG